MYNERVNKAMVRILKLVHRKEMALTEIASSIKKSHSWTSKSVARLRKMGFLNVRKVRRVVKAKLASTPLGESLSALISEGGLLNLDMVLGRSSLKIIPLLLDPGYEFKRILKKTCISSRTIQSHLKKWRQMGIVIFKDKKYKLNQRNRFFIDFVKRYSEHRNLKHLHEAQPETIIIWQDRDEYIISADRPIEDDRFKAAATTMLPWEEYDLVSKYDYYLYSADGRQVSEAEALVQSLLIYEGNPRIPRMIRKVIRSGRISMEDLRKYASKYVSQNKLEGLAN